MLFPKNVRVMPSFINEECSRRRHSNSIVLAFVGCVLATLVNSASGQQPYPSKPIIAFAKVRPGQINFASSGSASGSRIAGDVFNMLAGVRMQNIPYKCGAQELTDAIGGHVHVSYNSPAISAPHVNSGRLRGVAISGDPRLPLLSQVPTFIEGGLPRRPSSR